VLGRQLFDVMALAGAAEDHKPGRQRETGSAKKKSHNASDSKRLGLEGARTKARGVDRALRRAMFILRGFAAIFFDIERRSARSTGATLRIESRFRRITVSRSGSNFQKHRVE